METDMFYDGLATEKGRKWGCLVYFRQVFFSTAWLSLLMSHMMGWNLSRSMNKVFTDEVRVWSTWDRITRSRWWRWRGRGKWRWIWKWRWGRLIFYHFWPPCSVSNCFKCKQTQMYVQPMLFYLIEIHNLGILNMDQSNTNSKTVLKTINYFIVSIIVNLFKVFIFVYHF